MKILFFGDSITDMGRNREEYYSIWSYGMGYVSFVAGELLSENPQKYQILNRGISGDRSVDLYARIKREVWEEKPDVLSILVGINDIWHDINLAGGKPNGVDPERYEKVMQMLIEDTKKVLPDVKIILCEPFVLHGTSTDDLFEEFKKVSVYAKIVKKLTEKYGLYYLPLQETLTNASERIGNANVLYDGVHPAVGGGKIIADEWIKLFKEKVEKNVKQ